MCDLTLPGTTENMIEFHQRRVLLLNGDDRGHSHEGPDWEHPSPYIMDTRLPKVQRLTQLLRLMKAFSQATGWKGDRA